MESLEKFRVAEFARYAAFVLLAAALAMGLCRSERDVREFAETAAAEAEVQAPSMTPLEETVASGDARFFGLTPLDRASADAVLENCAVDDALSLELFRDGAPVPFDRASGTFLLPVEAEVVTDDFIGFGGILHLTASSKGSVYIVEGAGTSPSELIAGGDAFELIVTDGSSASRYRLVLTTLPVMCIDTDTIFSEEVPIWDDDIFGTARFMECDGAFDGGEMRIHARGGSSKSNPKISYKLNLLDSEGAKRDANFLGLRRDNDWILLAMYSDETKVRDKLSYDLWQDMSAYGNTWGVCNGAEIEYIELILNGEYHGLYGLVVPMDKKQLSLKEKYGESLFKISSWEIPLARDIARLGDDVEEYYFVEQKNPSPATQKAWDMFGNFVRVAYESTDEEFLRELPLVCDIDNLVDFWIFVNVGAQSDGMWKNVNVAFKYLSSGGMCALYSPWDCDLSWGVTYDIDAPLQWRYETFYFTGMLDYKLSTRMYDLDVDGYRAKVAARWAELREGLLSEESLLERVDALDEALSDSGALTRESERWQDGGYNPDGCEYIRDYIRSKLAYMDVYIGENFAGESSETGE